MDLVCANPVQTSFMITVRYIAYGLIGLFVFSIPDIFGRKWTLFINFALQLGFSYLMIFVPSYQIRLTGFLVQGLTMLKGIIPFCYIAELVPTSNKAMTTIVITAFDLASLMVLNSYFLLISRDWMPIQLATTILATFALLYSMVFIPESPHWLLSQGRLSEAIDAFNSIAKFNGVKYRVPQNATFKECLQ